MDSYRYLMASFLTSERCKVFQISEEFMTLHKDNNFVDKVFDLAYQLAEG